MKRIARLDEESSSQLEKMMGETLFMAIQASMDDPAIFYEAVKTAESVFKVFANQNELKALEAIDMVYDLLSSDIDEESSEVAQIATELGDTLGVGALLKQHDNKLHEIIKELGRKKISVFMRIYWRLFYSEGVKQRVLSVGTVMRDLEKVVGKEIMKDIKKQVKLELEDIEV